MITRDDLLGMERVEARLSRRRLVGRLAAAGFTAPVIASILARHGGAQGGTPVAGGDRDSASILAELGKDPELFPHGTTTFGTPMHRLDGLLVPNDLFFIRSNGPVAVEIPAEEWRLRVHGLVENELELSLDDLRRLPERTLIAFLECSGNSRGRFSPQAEGTQWGNDAVGNAEWTGISLREVLERAGVRDGAVDVVSQGGDFPEMQRGLPLHVAMDPDTMLVWGMNGEDLPAPHGGPVRLFVPRWSGIASTKWIVDLEVIDRVFDGPYNSESYVIIDEDERVVRPVREVPVKSIITSPAPDDRLSPGEQTIAGYAWSGYGGIEAVEISTDGGQNWDEAEITEEAGPLSWVRFEYPWRAEAGEARLRSRATDELGIQQPETVPWNAKGYLMNAIDEVPVTVE